MHHAETPQKKLFPQKCIYHLGIANVIIKTKPTCGSNPTNSIKIWLHSSSSHLVIQNVEFRHLTPLGSKPLKFDFHNILKFVDRNNIVCILQGLKILSVGGRRMGNKG